MSTVNMVDETFIAAGPAQVAELLSERRRWREWWPDLQLTVLQDRGPRGMRWRMAGALQGDLELWLQPVLDGTVVHHILHADLGAAGPRQAAKHLRHRRLAAKALAFELKAHLEAGRAPGEAPHSLA